MGVIAKEFWEIWKMRNRVLWCFLFYSGAVWADVCPDGRIAMVRSASIVPQSDCSDGLVIGTADTVSFPQISCGIGVSVLETGGGNTVSVYNDKYSSPALHVFGADGVCYVHFVPDDIENTLHVKFQNRVYSAQDVALCFVANADAGASLVQSQVDSVNWGSMLDGDHVKGVSYCSNQSGEGSSFQDALTVASYDEENLYCWCRTIVPVVSRWGFSMEFASEFNCGKYCAARCAEQFADDVDFRHLLLDNFYMVN